MSERRCLVVRLEGLTNYDEGLRLQERAGVKVRTTKIDGVLLLLEHRPVLTLGRSGGRENLLVSETELQSLGVELRNSTRGGNITYHGPGQIVAYPVFNLASWKRDLPWYVTKLEEVVISLLRDYGAQAGRKPEYRGVWVNDKKIAAVGIAVKRWITLHGFAFNVQVNKKHFALINPCGIKDFVVASLDDFVETINFAEVVNKVKEKFSLLFETDFEEVSIEWLESDKDD